jgi:ElaB/YqjD/DUF883 family membrane-anchored ribosome-binding protein
MMRSELGEGFDHLKQAAAHAAGSISDNVAPRVMMARDYTKPVKLRDAAMSGLDTTMTALAPLAAMARDGASQAQKMPARQMKMLRARFGHQPPPRRRWPMLLGLLVAGTAVGAAGAAVLRRRRQHRWDEFDADRAMEAVNAPAGPFDTSMGSQSPAVDKAADKAADKATKVMDKAASRVAAATDKGTEKMSSTMSSARDKIESATEATKPKTGQATEKADGMLGKTPSRNNRGT